MTSTPKTTYDEAVEGLSGYDEVAIEKKFGTDLDSLRLSMQLRALFFVRVKGGGSTEADAYKQAMELTVKQLGDEFPDTEAEPVPSDPVTVVGKDDASLA